MNLPKPPKKKHIEFQILLLMPSGRWQEVDGATLESTGLKRLAGARKRSPDKLFQLCKVTTEIIPS